MSLELTAIFREIISFGLGIAFGWVVYTWRNGHLFCSDSARSADVPAPELINADSPLTQEMIDKGRKAWADVPSASAWVESLRGGDDTANLQSNGNTQ